MYAPSMNHTAPSTRAASVCVSLRSARIAFSEAASRAWPYGGGGISDGK